MSLISRALGALGAVSKAARGLVRSPSNGRKVVFDVKRQSPGDLGAQDRHEQRIAGDVSHIEPSRSHLNRRRAYGDHLLEPSTAVDAYIHDKGARVDPRNKAPCTSFVLSASHEWFKGDGPHGFNDERVRDWSNASMKWLESNFGEDVVHVSLHMDEKTPHIHAKIVPIVERITKRGTVVRQVSHHSHPAFKGRRSYERLLTSYAEALEPLGLERGDSLPDGARADTRTARQWVDDQARAIAREKSDQAKERDALNRQDSQQRERAAELAQIRAELVRDRLALTQTHATLEQSRRELQHAASGVMHDLQALGRIQTVNTGQVARSEPLPPVPALSTPPVPEWSPPAHEKRARRKKRTGQSRDE